MRVGVAALALARVFDDAAELTRARELLEPLGTWGWHRELGLRRPGTRSRPACDRPARAAGSSRRTGRPRVDGRPAPANPAAAGRGVSGRTRARRLQLRCFGGFSLDIGGRPFDESAAKPMERALLHLLAARAGEPVHREALMEALWPEADPDAGLHRLQVAISSLRRLLAVEPAETAPRLIREGDSYRLALPDDADCDVWQFDAHLRRAARARSTGSPASRRRPWRRRWASTAARCCQATVPPTGSSTAGPPSSRRPSTPPPGWRNLRLSRASTGRRPRPPGSGLSLDRYRDELWRLLIEAADRSGHHAEAGQARRAYAAVLDELGV